jgi:hypothetical protein
MNELRQKCQKEQRGFQDYDGLRCCSADAAAIERSEYEPIEYRLHEHRVVEQT